MGSSSFDIGYSLALDNAGDIVLTGYFTDTADFDEGGNAANLQSSGINDFDLFLAKYNPANGDLIWANGMGAGGQETGFGVGVDNSDNIYLTGRFGATVDFDPDPNTTANVSATGLRDIFLAKYQSDGSHVWSKGMGGNGEDWGFDLVVDPAANVYLTGSFSGTVDFDPNAGNGNAYQCRE